MIKIVIKDVINLYMDIKIFIKVLFLLRLDCMFEICFFKFFFLRSFLRKFFYYVSEVSKRVKIVLIWDIVLVRYFVM